MSASEPPRVATWLLKRLAASGKRESLVGDLIEQYQQGRSRAWYWRQAIAAIFGSIANDIRAHKLLALRAAILGLVLYQLAAFPVIFLSNLFVEVPPRLLVYIGCAFTGVIVARLHPTYRTAMVCVASVSVLFFESLHVALGIAFDGGRHALTPQMLIIANTLMLGRPISILVGGLSVPPRRRSPNARAI